MVATQKTTADSSCTAMNIGWCFPAILSVPESKYDNDNSFYFQTHNDAYNITFLNIASDLGNKEKV